MLEDRVDGACEACDGLADRRQFLKEIAVAAASAFIALGASRREAAAMPLTRLVGTLSATATSVSYPIPAADGATIDPKNEIIITRYLGSIYAFDLSCPHQHTALKWLPEDNRFQCPKHKSKYEPTGKFISGRATRNMDRHPIKLDAGKLVVDVDNLIQSDKDPAGWESASVKP